MPTERETGIPPDAITDAEPLPSYGWIAPMRLAVGTLKEIPARWYCEAKYDGWRCIGSKQDDHVRLWSRSKRLMTPEFPDVASELHKIKGDIIFDGELVKFSNGLPKRDLLRRRRAGEEVYMVFDVLYANGRNLTGSPLSERKKILKKALPRTLEHIQAVTYRKRASPKELLEAARRIGVEGLVFKNPDSVYRPGKISHNWKKIKPSSQT